MKSGSFAKAVVLNKPSEPHFYVCEEGIIQALLQNGVTINVARLWDLYNYLRYLGPKSDMQLQ